MKPVTVNYTKTRRDEMTFGYLKDSLIPGLVPDENGSVKFYTPQEVANLMTTMDESFAGVRRSTIDKLENVRQIILYTVIAKVIGGVVKVGVYRRSAGSEAKLEGKMSFGFGGHLETQDLSYHEVNGKVSGNTVSSYYSTLASGYREVTEEVEFVGTAGLNRLITPIGFLSDLKPEVKGWVGNTHLGVIGLIILPEEADFVVLETNYTKLDWMGKEELSDQKLYLEPWSKLLLDSFDELQALAASVLLLNLP